MYQALLFDMDGVVVDTQHSVREFWQRIARSEGFSLSTSDLARHVYGHRADHTLRKVFPQIQPACYKEVYQSLREDQESLNYTAIPGVLQLLEGLAEAGIPLALVTGAENWKVAAVLGQLNLTDAFDTHICAHDVASGKPDPACYLLAAQRLCVDIAQCLVFEDAISGVNAAIAAGADCVAIAGPQPASQVLAAGALAVADDFTEIRFDSYEYTLSMAGKTVFPFWPTGARRYAGATGRRLPENRYP